MLVEMTNGIPTTHQQAKGQIGRLENETSANLPNLSVLAMLLPG